MPTPEEDGLKEEPEASGFGYGSGKPAGGDYDGDANIDPYNAEPAGIETFVALGQCAFWFDYDDDGKLDLFVKDYESPNRLYKNNGDGTLTQLSNAPGLADATLGALPRHGLLVRRLR